MFLIRIYLRERPGTHNLRKLMHAAGAREAISALLFHRVLHTLFPEIASRVRPLCGVERIRRGRMNCDNLRDLCDDRGSEMSRETNINT